jgi:hypothetical protein
MTCKDNKCDFNKEYKCLKGKDKFFENTVITCKDSKNYKNLNYVYFKIPKNAVT